MAVIYGTTQFGMFENGNFESGTNKNFNFGTINNTDAFSGKFCLEITGGGGSTFISPQRLEVDTTLTYQMITYARTLQRGSQNNSLAGGHIGFACFDKNDVFIELRNCGGLGNTILSRDLIPGDSYAYIASNAGWSTGTNSAFRHLIIYPSSHPDYSVPYQYTRIGFGNPTITYNLPITLMPEGDYRLELTSTFPNVGYSTPSGTPVSNGQAGGTYNYALGDPNYPESWTRYATAPFTGESRTSSTPFRFSTKFIRFLILRNYNQRSEVPQDHIWALDNIFFGLCVNNRDYRDVL